ncbi:MAG: ADP-ribosylglycohydrolase family protein [Blautia sp.]|nr:ADP-ribosylglycohydrolase family protein [Blautia sp.]MDY3998569.1 ADP-ribosylglycohydrolase family protein [Blautia sp.]
MKYDRNIWMDGIMGVIVGDALGVPVEFLGRNELSNHPVTTMRGYGTYHLPEGSWSDDSSMTLATLDSLKDGFHPEDIMEKFVCWIKSGEYTPFGKVFDVGNTCYDAIIRYSISKNINTCGRSGEHDNGNGSLMRILPICLYAYEKQHTEGITDEAAISMIHTVSALTHNHIRSKIACGLYYFMVRSILDRTGNLPERLQHGITDGINYYEESGVSKKELAQYSRITDLKAFKEIPADQINSSGYVVATSEAAVWSLINTNSFAKCVLKAVNLGYDTDTVAAVAGGLAGLYYGYANIPEEWLDKIQKRNWIEQMCKRIDQEPLSP